MRSRSGRWGVVLLALTLLGARTVLAQAASIPLSDARAAFALAERLAGLDADQLWGRSLYGPTLFVHPESRQVVANARDAEGRLRAQDGLFVGTLDSSVAIANTSVHWAGTDWTMLTWPLPQDRYARGRLLMHESFHRVQPALGIPLASPVTPHLDSAEARRLLRLEWRALREALIHTGAARAAAVADALRFRRERHSRFPEGARAERALELNEGLAEYTGIRLSGWPASIWADRAAVRLESEEREPGVRTFAYAAGAAWALLLDAYDLDWRTRLSAEADLAALLAARLDPKRDGHADVVSLDDRASHYDDALVRADEARRESARRETLARLRRRFVDGPVLRLPLSDAFSYAFGMRGNETLAGEGSILGSASLHDSWGALEVRGGVLLVRDARGVPIEARVSLVDAAAVDWRTLTAPLRTSATATTEAWALTLAPGWVVQDGERAGDRRLRRTP